MLNSHKRAELTGFKYQEPYFFARIFDDPKEDTFDILTVCTKVDMIRKLVPGAPKLYFLSIGRGLVCYVHCHKPFLLVKNLQHTFEGENYAPLKQNHMLQFTLTKGIE